MVNDQKVWDEFVEAQASLKTKMEIVIYLASRIRDERDQAIYVIDTIIANMKDRLDRLVISEGNDEAGKALAIEIAHWLDYARDQRSRLPWPPPP